MGIYAVIKTGGKQYRVSPGDIMRVEKLSAQPGSFVEFTDVFLFVNDSDVAVGAPTVTNVRVVAEVLEQGRGEKIRIIKKRRRKHHQKTMGHRQYYSAIRISEIIQGDESFKAIAGVPKKKEAPAPKMAPLVQPPAATKSKQPPQPTSAPDTSRSSHSSNSPVAKAPRGSTKTDRSAPPGADDMRPPVSETNIQEGSAVISPQGRLTPVAETASAKSDSTTFRRNAIYLSLAALLLALISWLSMSDKEEPPVSAAPPQPPTELATEPKQQLTEQEQPSTRPATEQQPPQPAVKDVKVLKPGRAMAPTAPAQPPD